MWIYLASSSNSHLLPLRALQYLILNHTDCPIYRYKMYTKTLALALALSSAVSASPLNRRQDACQATYKSCIASGTPEVACQCDLTACVGEDAARIRSFCATATAGLVRSSSAAAPVPTSIPVSYLIHRLQNLDR